MFNYREMCFTIIYSIFFWHSGDIGGYIGHCLGDVRSLEPFSYDYTCRVRLLSSSRRANLWATNELPTGKIYIMNE